MLVVYIAALLAGLALAVRVMIAGVLRPLPPGTPDESVPARRARWSPALGAAGAAVFGVVGAALAKLGWLGGGGRFAVALVSAAGAVGLAGLVLKLWALHPGAPADPEDSPEHQLQGFPATVTRQISAGSEGEIVFRYDGVQRTFLARSIDGATLAPGDEVVIDRLDNGMAWVEAWARVESRL